MSRLPPLATLRAFEAAARHLSFGKAAEELLVTPSAISHQIKLLESILGVPLFRRRPRPLALTDAGATLFPVFRDGFVRFQHAIDRIDRDRPLQIATTSAFAAKWLMPRLAGSRGGMPRPALSIDASEELADLNAGEADAAIRYQRLPPSDLASISLVSDRYLPMAAPALLERLGPVARAADLVRYPLIHFRWKNKDPHAPSWGRWIDEAQRIDPEAVAIDRQAGQRFSEATLAIDSAVAGQGVVLASDVDAAGELEAGRLVALTGVALAGFNYFLVSLPGHPRKAEIEELAAWLKAEIFSVRIG